MLIAPDWHSAPRRYKSEISDSSLLNQACFSVQSNPLNVTDVTSEDPIQSLFCTDINVAVQDLTGYCREINAHLD